MRARDVHGGIGAHRRCRERGLGPQGWSRACDRLAGDVHREGEEPPGGYQAARDQHLGEQAVIQQMVREHPVERMAGREPFEHFHGDEQHELKRGQPGRHPARHLSSRDLAVPRADQRQQQRTDGQHSRHGQRPRPPAVARLGEEVVPQMGVGERQQIGQGVPQHHPGGRCEHQHPCAD